MRVFLSFHSRDHVIAAAVRDGLLKLEPAADVFFSPISLGAGFWLPKLAEAIGSADAFLLVIGPHGVGPWQEVEYHAALDRHVATRNAGRGFPLVPMIAGAAEAPGLPFLRNLNWVTCASMPAEAALHQTLVGLKGETLASTTPLWRITNPYRGLMSMTGADTAYFFGRTAETRATLHALANNRGKLPVLIGASGVGKSSVAQAGVLSSLRAMGLPGPVGPDAVDDVWPAGLAASRNWVPVILRPGETPLQALADAVVALWDLDRKMPENAALPRQWAHGLASGRNKLADLIDACQMMLQERAGQAPSRFVLYLDQGEELYTRADPNAAQRFSEVLAEGLSDKRLLAFMSLRADYFPAFQADQALFPLREHIDIAPLDRSGLTEIVTAPPGILGVGFEDDRLAPRITDAAAAEGAGALPLLSYLMTDMWAAMRRRAEPVLRLPGEAIDIGGVLAARAEAFLHSSPKNYAALRRLLTLRLASVLPLGEPVRRQALREECAPDEWNLASQLAEAEAATEDRQPLRLVVVREREDGRVVAEVAHERLLSSWPRLTAWLHEERDFLVFKADVERAEKRWQEMQQSDRALLSGLDLARAQERLPQRPGDFSEPARAFMRASIGLERARTAREVLEREREAREREQMAAEREEAAQQAERFYRRGRRLTWSLLAVTLLMMGSLLWLARETDRREIAVYANLAGQAMRDQQFERAMRYALLAVPPLGALSPAATSSDVEGKLAMAALSTRLKGSLTGHTKPVRSVAFSPDGHTIVSASDDGTAKLWSVEHRNVLLTLEGHTAQVSAAAFSPDGLLIATASWDGTARVWNAQNGGIVAKLEKHKTHINGLEFSPDGKTIATASSDGSAKIWQTATGKLLWTLSVGSPEPVATATFSPDGTLIATASWDKSVRLWDVRTGQKLTDLVGHRGPVTQIAFNPDGTLLVSGSVDATAIVWDLEAAKPKHVLKEHRGALRSVAFSPAGDQILTTADDQTGILWHANSGTRALQPLRGHADAVWFGRFSPDGRRVITVSWDKTARLWDATTGAEIAALKSHTGRVLTAAFSPDSETVATASEDGTVRLWDAAPQKSVAVFTRHGQDAAAAAKAPGANVSAPTQRAEPGACDQPTDENLSVNTGVFNFDGSRVITGSTDRTARIWESATGKELLVLRGHSGIVLGVAFSPKGDLAATSSGDCTARIWDAATGTLKLTIKGHTDRVTAVTFSPDGQLLLTASSDESARIWEVATGNIVGVLRGHTGIIWDAGFSSDGSKIVTASDDRSARIFDSHTMQQLAVIEHPREVNSASFSPDGSKIVTASDDQVTRVWNTKTRALISAMRGHENWVHTARFSPDGRRIVTASEDATVRLWDVESGSEMGALRPHARVVNTAALSPDGRRIVTTSDDGSARVSDVSWIGIYGADLRERVCAQALGAHQSLTDDDLIAPSLTRIGNDPIARNPCLRRGPLAMEYWRRLPGEAWRMVSPPQ